MTEPATGATGPTVDLPLAEAIQELTGFEAIGIQRKFGADLESLGGVRTLLGAVWAFENRREKTEWSTVERMSLRQLAAYFADTDPDPDGEQGKAQPRPGAQPTS